MIEEKQIDVGEVEHDKAFWTRVTNPKGAIWKMNLPWWLIPQRKRMKKFVQHFKEMDAKGYPYGLGDLVRKAYELHLPIPEDVQQLIFGLDKPRFWNPKSPFKPVDPRKFAKENWLDRARKEAT